MVRRRREPSGQATTATISKLIVQPVRTNARMATWVFVRCNAAVARAISVFHFWTVVKITATGLCRFTMFNERCATNPRKTNMTVSYSCVDSRWQGETYTTGDNSDDPEADHLTDEDQHKMDHLGMLTFGYWCCPVCPFRKVLTMTATGFCQLTMDNEIIGISSRLTILTGKYLYLGCEAQGGPFWTGDNSNDPDADHLTGQDQHKNGHLGIYEVRFSTAVARAIPVCRFYAVEKISATGFSLVR